MSYRYAVAVFVFLYTSFISVCLGQTVDDWINSVKWIDSRTKPITAEQIDQYINSSSVYIQVQVNNPVFYYFRGRLGFLKRGQYQRSLLKEGKTYRLDDPINQTLIADYQRYYRKAFEVDETREALAHLNEEMLVNMNDVLASPSLRVLIFNKMIQLNDGGDNEMMLYDYSGLFNAYLELGQFSSAEEVLDKMGYFFSGGAYQKELGFLRTRLVEDQGKDKLVSDTTPMDAYEMQQPDTDISVKSGVELTEAYSGVVDDKGNEAKSRLHSSSSDGEEVEVDTEKSAKNSTATDLKFGFSKYSWMVVSVILALLLFLIVRYYIHYRKNR